MLAVVRRFASIAIFIIIARFSVASEVKNVLENPELKEALTILQLENIFQREIPSSVNESCRNQLVLYADGVKRKKTWALQMLDATWKMPPNIFGGNLDETKMNDQCLSVNVREENENFALRGRYCTVFLRMRALNLIKHPRVSFCLPAVCNESTIDAIIQEIMKNSTIFQKAGIEHNFSTCSKIDSNGYSTKDILAVSTLVSIVAALLFISICDVIDDYFGKLSAFAPIRGSFKYSIYRNVKKLFKKTAPDKFPVINGLRTISMFWIMCLHEYTLPVFSPFANFIEILSWHNSWSTLFYLSGFPSVDTFFTISGFLVSYNFVKDMSNGKKFHLISFYLRRYIRLTPLLMMTFLCNILLSKIGSDPSWDWNMDIDVNSCYEKFSTISLYLENFFYVRTDCLCKLIIVVAVTELFIIDLNLLGSKFGNSNNKKYVLIHMFQLIIADDAAQKYTCMMNAWYLAAEMQLYWLSPFFLHALVKKPKLGYFTLGIAVIFSTIYQATTIINYEILMSYSYNISADEALRTFEYIHVKPTTRIGPYAIGMIFGYIIATKKFKLSRVYITLGWILAATCSLSVVFLTNKFASQHYKRDILLEIFFHCLSHPAWGFSVAWIIYTSSINNNQGFFGKFLSSALLNFLSKFSYGFYLTHQIVLCVTGSFTLTFFYWNPIYEVVKITEHLIVALIFAFFLTIVFEMPAATLMKSFDKGKKILVAEKSE